MEPFETVPIEDIDYVLLYNNLPTNEDKYLTVWNFIITNPEINVPVSIANYVIAYNLQRENILVMTVFDIIRSDYKINGLSIERTIEVMRYLNKLDETDPFVGLPDDLVERILSEFEFDQILVLCNISKRFGKICKNYRRTLFFRFLNDKGFNIAEYNPEIMCKALDLNKRIAYCNGTGNYTLEIHNTSEGKVIGVIKHFKNFLKKFDVKGVNNIISVLYYRGYILFLDSFGNVFQSGLIDDNDVNPESKSRPVVSKTNESPIKNKPAFSSLNNPIILPGLKNIVQIISAYGAVFFLDVNGNVYWNDKGNRTIMRPILNNIKKIFSDEKLLSAVFLNQNHEIYVYGHNKENKFLLTSEDLTINKPTKSNVFNNVKDIILGDDKVITITNDNAIIFQFRKDQQLGSPYIFDTNIVKIKNKYSGLFILDEYGVLTEHDIWDLSNKNNEVDDVKDFEFGEFYSVILLNSNEIIIEDGEIPITTNPIKGKIILLDGSYVLIDNILYYLQYVPKNRTINLVKIE
jgi:hypothetical protein